MKLKIVVMALKTDRMVKEDTSKLRGYIGNKFYEHVLLHHHTEKGNLYTYPRVQYKIIEGTPIIVGIEEGAKILKKISDEINELKLGRSKYEIKSIQMNFINTHFGKSRRNIRYRFLIPWLALSQKNYAKYKSIKDWKEKKELLNNILAGNIISICKSFGYTVKGKIYAHSLLYEKIVNYKAIPHNAFIGEFKINFYLPDFIGIGKGVSHGFGTVKKIENDRKQIVMGEERKLEM